MKKLLLLFSACALSIALYLIMFGFVLSRPLVVDEIGFMQHKKLSYAASLPSPKIVIFAGSNARFSHSCATLVQDLHMPCANMGIMAMGTDWQLEGLKLVLRPGDIVYLPLEYSLYRSSPALVFSLPDAAYLFRRDRAALARRGAEGMLRGAFVFDLTTFINSVGEMALKSAGIRRRAEVENLNENGDQIGHDGRAALAYADVLKHAKFRRISAASLMDDAAGPPALGGFLDWCHAQGVTAIGGLPTTFDDVPIPDAVIAKLRAFYAAHDAQFLVLDNRSQYPRSAFFDVDYHLREAAQIAHSEKLATALSAYLHQSDSRGGPPADVPHSAAHS